MTLDELRQDEARLLDELAVAGVTWLQYRVRGDFVGMRQVDVTIEEGCRALRRVERKIHQEEKRARPA